MCNLYTLTDKDTTERYFRSLSLHLDAYPVTTVGPFQTGLMVCWPDTSAGHTAQGWMGQWGMIQPGSRTRRPASRSVLTNNARIESVAQRPTYRDAWRLGHRCLIPAAWYQEPNWETGRNIWWRMRRADGLPWALAGLWSQWIDPATGEIVANYTMITCNSDGHPLLGRLHKPNPKLPPDHQDKRSVAHIDPVHWETWLKGTQDQAWPLVRPPATEMFDLSDAQHTDRLLARQ